MNATQVISRRFVVGMGPRLTAPVQHSSTAMKPKERTLMRAVFTGGTVVTATGVLYGVSFAAMHFKCCMLLGNDPLNMIQANRTLLGNPIG